MADPGHFENPRTCFLVGVSGYMDLVADEVEPLKQRVRRLFQFLRHGASRQLVDQLVADLVPDPVSDEHSRRLRSGYRAALSRWKGLGAETPIVVLCNLAPGVDTLVAELVLDEFLRDNFQLRYPLPFPPHIYCGASTFVRFKDGHAVEGNQNRQRAFLRILARMGQISHDVVCAATGTQELSSGLHDALQAVSPETFFAVRLHEDMRCDEAALTTKWLDDRDTSDRRNLRYYAAGEYLTVNAHLLLAVWDGQRDASRAGTSTIVDARLTGPRQGLLASTAGVPLPHGGPAWHLMAHRTSPAHNPTGDEPSSLPPLRILHPCLAAADDDPPATIIAETQPTDLDLQIDRLNLFARIGESLRNFNSPQVRAKRDPTIEFEKLLDQRIELHQRLKADQPGLHARVRRISDMRCRSSDLTDYYQDRVKRTLTRLVWMTFFAAVGLHVLTHWHPRKVANEIVSNHVEIPGDNTEAAATPESEHLVGVQLVAGWLALTLTIVGVSYFGWQRSRKLEAHGHDTRAIAEGLRIQFYWDLAGLGKSVAANYMSRDRSELDWISGVIRATSMPCELVVLWFSALPRELQLQMFRVVQSAWVQGQLKYFGNASHREHHRVHVWHKLGGLAALAGVLVYLKIIGQESWPAVASCVQLVCHVGFALPLLVVVVYLAWYAAYRSAIHTAAAENKPVLFADLKKAVTETARRAGKQPRKLIEASRWMWPVSVLVWIWEWLKSAGWIALEVVNVLVPTRHDAGIMQSTFWKRLLRGVLGFLAYWPLSLVIAGAACGVCHGLADSFATLPSPMTLKIIVAGILLLGGALSVAWAEKNLHSELAYQYNTMAILFEAANRRLDRELHEFAATLDDRAAGPKHVERIQSLLFELGQEALDENAEWLLLHRARPLEPVMAG